MGETDETETNRTLHEEALGRASTQRCQDPRATPRSTAFEAGVVYGGTVGVMLLSHVIRGSATVADLAFTGRHLWGVLGFEVVLAALLVPWLRRRGWRPLAVAGRPVPRDLVRGAGVWLLAIGCYAAVWILFATLDRGAAAALATEHRFGGAPAGPLPIVLVSLVNPVFEEFLWLAYGVARLEGRLGLRTASALSVALRVAVHLYQGPLALVGVLPVAVAFTWYYGRTRRLWPVIVAHASFDAIGLAARLLTGP